MEEMLRSRILLRHKKLTDTRDEIQSKIDLYSSGQVLTEEELTSYRLNLKHVIGAFDEELKLNLEKMSEGSPDITRYMEDLISAEDLLVKLNCVNEIYQKAQEKKPDSTKLPKLDLTKFDGNILHWHEFWDKFEANIDSKNLKDVEKLAYLLGSLQGPALETVSGLATTNANYLIAVDALKKRFGSSYRVVDAHYDAINKMQRAKDNPSECRQVYDMIEKHLRVLQTLGENIESNHLRVTIAGKFPERVMYQVNLISPDDRSVPTLRSNLDKVLTAIEHTGGGSDTVNDKLKIEIPGTSTTGALQLRTESRPRQFQPNRKRKQEGSPTTTPTKRTRLPCLFCGLRNHNSADCRKFKSVEARKDRLKNRCLHCLRRNHQTKDCKKKIKCFRCQGDHPRILCPKGEEGEQLLANTKNNRTVCDISHGFTFLQTAVAKISNPENSKQINSRLLLDSGSQRSYITERVAKTLGLSTVKEDQLLIYTFGASTPQETSSPSTEVAIETRRGVKRKLQVNIVQYITDHIRVPEINYDNIDIPADDGTAGEGVDVLVGNDFYCSFLREDKITIDTNLYLIDTDFGWILSGNTAKEEETNILSVTTYCQCHIPSCPYFAEPDLPLRNIDIKFLWSLESIGITDSPKVTRQEEAVRHFNETVQYKDGRYEVKWPWVEYPPDLPLNFGLVLGRLRSLTKRLDKDSFKEYNDILGEQLDLGIIEMIEPGQDEENGHPIHYLPHHMVKQKGKRGRLVYDASAKTIGQKSLNECLYSGPSMLEDLTALLIKFRTKRIGLVADVEKAFLQVGLQHADRDVTRFLWLKDITKQPTDDNLMYLRFCRVPFGVISSPFLLTATIRHHMSQSNQELLKTIANKCYVDNLVTGADTSEEASHIYEQTRSTFEELAMNIRDWVSNDKQFLDTVPQQYKGAEAETVKVLGLLWNISKDNLMLKVTDDHFKPDPPIHTKRGSLRALARVYDPCGFVCPLILPLKLLFQKICENKVKWDSELPEDMIETLNSNLGHLKAVTKIKLPRYIGITSPDRDTTYELHCFADASKNAYAAVVYLRSQGGQDTVISFIMAKSRISQSQDRNDLKIPKLELLAFLIGSRLLKYVKASLDLSINKEYLWTDSLVVLGWMRSNKLLPPFVANRVNEIKRNHKETEMCYINTKSNPADIATRPEPELWDQRKELWYNGPEFLKKNKSDWPVNRDYDSHKTFFSAGEALDHCPGVLEVELEEWPVHDQHVAMEIDDPETYDQGHADINIGHDNSLDDITLEIKKLQQKHFPDELAGKRTHLVKNLDLFLDVDGILRCRGRMANTTWNYDMKYPILLPKDSDFTNKIIRKTHEGNYHVGASHTLNIIREHYWIPQGKAQVVKVLKRCPQCVKHGGGPYKLPSTPALPAERVNYCDPFSFTGVDYFGPLYVTTQAGKEKRWAVLFTCLTIRAIHLEIVNDLSAEECLLALRRFAASRSTPKRMYSDNATCFKLTSEVMAKPYCIEKRIEWKFIPQLAPWHGGFYERLVGLVKHCLKRTLEKHLLNDAKLLTIMKEVEAVVNTRPLTRIGTEVIHVLRPADFLSLGKCLMEKPPSVEIPCTGTTAKANLIDSWKRGLKILEEFKKMFVGQYLTSLRERSKHSPKQPRIRSEREPCVGDLVQIKSEAKNRENWKIGKIIALIEGLDGQCRVAKVKAGDSILTRSVGHLYPLETDTDDETPSGESVIQEEPEQANTSMLETPGLDPVIELSDGACHNDGQVPNREVQPLSDATATPGNETISPMEIGPIHEVCEEHTGVEGQSVTKQNASDETAAGSDVPISEAEEVTRGEGRVRSRRDAAIRAREKILQWTRHLLVLLQ